MARAIFFNLPFYGHVNPTLPLVTELTRRGDHITYYASETFRPAIEQAGATFRGMDAYMTERTPADGNLVRFACKLIEVTRAMLPELLAEARANPPDYILFDSLSIWGRCVAEILGIPAIASVSTMATPHSTMRREILVAMLPFMPRSARMMIEGRRELRAFNAISRELHETYHVPRIQFPDAYNNLADLNIIYSIRELQLWPNAFDERFKFVGPLLGRRDDDSSFPIGDLGDLPIIYISLGTVFNEKEAFYRHCFEAFADLNRRVVLSTGEKIDPARLGAIPANFIVRSFVPQLEMLRHAALFITHGGMNSVNEGLYNDVPLLLVPQAADQFFIARRLQQLGVGIMLHPQRISAEKLRRAADTLLTDPTFNQRSASLGEALRHAGSPADAIDAIDAFKRKHGV